MSRPQFCDDCEVDCSPFTEDGIGEQYMVSIQTWFRTHGPYDIPPRYLCIGCLEARIGYTVLSGDFLPCPNNFDPSLRRSPRLVDRMTRSRP